jgi:hypothetical protein
MRLSRGAPLAALAALLLALSAPGPVVATSAGQRPAPGGPSIHSSDGVRGPLLERRLVDQRPSARTTAAVSWRVVPGLRYRSWSSDEPQGPTQVHVLAGHLDRAGLSLDQVSGPDLTDRVALSQLVRDDGAVAGTNANFFDIDDTGAPLGIGVDQQQGLLHAARTGWLDSFFLDQKGVPRSGQPTLVASVTRVGGATYPIGAFNQPHVNVDAIGLYTAAWGTSPGRRVVDGASHVRQVVVRGGVVRSNRTRLPAGRKIDGSLLIGRGNGADRLRKLKVGQRVRIATALDQGAVKAAVSGSEQILRDGKVIASTSRELHPRTAVGIDVDRNIVHLVVVDGRSESSSGMTLVQLARLLQSLGDEAAINLDGGGSSEMVAPNRNGRLGVRSSPSDGSERPVPVGLVFTYQPPAG